MRNGVIGNTSDFDSVIAGSIPASSARIRIVVYDT